MKITSQIKAVGSYLPSNIVSNDDLAKTINTSDEWIRERTGIKQRAIADDKEFTSDLAVKAVKNALKTNDFDLSTIDLIICATTTPDLTFPATAAIIQHKLAIKQCGAFDIQAVCSGFVYALSVADKMIKSGANKKVLVIGCETFSRIIDWQDRSTCILFGDGAGCFILEAHEEEEEDHTQNNGIIATNILCQGDLTDILYVNGGVSSTKTTGFVQMNGQKVFKIATDKMSTMVKDICCKANISIDDIDWLVPHQANKRILSAVAKRLNINSEKIISTIDIHANTSAASIPLAFDYGIKQNKIKKGDLICMVALGGGISWGGVLCKY